MEQFTPETYDAIVKEKNPPSPLWKDCLLAFLVGGLICTIGQAVLEFYTSRGVGKQDAGICTSITMIALGAVFTGLGWYDKLAKFAGAGTIVPITGFSNAIVSPAMEFKSEGLVLGLGAKMFVIAGPVLVFGITASVVYGLILYCMGVGA